MNPEWSFDVMKRRELAAVWETRPCIMPSSMLVSYSAGTVATRGLAMFVTLGTTFRRPRSALFIAVTSSRLISQHPLQAHKTLRISILF